MTQTYTSKLLKDSKESTEAKILQRGEYYLTPFTLDHIDEVIKGLTKENVKELVLLGYTDIRKALVDMHESSECYLCRKNNEEFIMVGGLWFTEDQEWPQMFAMFSDKIRENFIAMARGSVMFVDYFDQFHSGLSMTILKEYKFILDWASWLGFEAVGIISNNEIEYVDFVRCNPNQKDVYDCTLQPVIH